MNDKVSIIVPIYNVARYLHQSINSVIRQSYSNWELVLVDDGSTDDSPLICDEYARADSRIRVLHKKNGGSSSARNTGVSNSTGDWIMMLDGDDWLEFDALEKCANEIAQNDVDYVKFGSFHRYIGFSKKALFPAYLEKNNMIKDFLARRVPLCIWNGIYKRELFDKISPQFPDGLNFGEDYSINPRLLYYSKKFSIINVPLYNYRILSSGYVGSSRWSNVEQLIGCEKIIYDFFVDKENGIFKEALCQGRTSIKAYAYSIILNDYKNYKVHYESIRTLYSDYVNLNNSSLDTKLLYFIMQGEISIRVFRWLWHLRIFMADVVKNMRKVDKT